MPERSTVVISRHWRARSELAFATRSIAGAASRVGAVVVMTPGPLGRHEPDGAFDLQGIGTDEAAAWGAMPRDSLVIVDELTNGDRVAGGPGFFLTAQSGAATPPWRRLDLVGGPAAPGVGLFVPVNPLATRARHHGFGFTGYLLVLAAGTGSPGEPPAAAAWLTSAFHEEFVVVVEDGVASAWKGRALRGATSVDTRTDLWRLMAHAAVCVDLGPGELVARECVEALRLGTPIIVPEHSAAAASHARAAGGSTFSDAGELLEAADKLRNEASRGPAVDQGRAYADEWYGDPQAFVDRVARRLARADNRPGPGSPTPVH
jgi:hypothetical protein